MDQWSHGDNERGKFKINFKAVLSLGQLKVNNIAYNLLNYKNKGR